MSNNLPRLKEMSDLGPRDLDAWELIRTRVQTGLEACGFAARDTVAILDHLAKGVSLQEVSRAIATGALLSKRSASGRKHVLSAVRRRYLDRGGALPDVPLLLTALRRVTNSIAQHQVLLPYLLLSDRGAYELATRLVLPRLATGGALPKAEVIRALDALLDGSGQRRWSAELRTRWAEGFLSVLRDVGALGRGVKRAELLPYGVRPEPFTFHLWGLYERGVRGAALHGSRFWRLLLLEPPEARHLVAAVADHGWWKFTSVGGADEVVPVHGSMTEWLTVGLG